MAGFVEDLGAVPVEVFQTSSAVPSHLWSIEPQERRRSFSQTVTIVGSDALQAGDSGRVYLHTSAGIRRYDIPALARLPEPTQEQYLEAVVSCLHFTKIFTPLEEILWLIDPPRFDYGFDPFRQWLFTFAEIPAFTRMTFHRYQNGERVGKPLSMIAGRSGEAAFEIVTDAATNIVVEHSAERISRGRVNQRWLLPTQVVAIERPTALIRSGSMLVVGGKSEVLSFDLISGLIFRRPGDLRVSKSAEGLVATETRPLFIGRHREVSVRPSAAQESHPFSVTLPDGKIAAAFEDKLVIGIPWGTLGMEPPRA